MQLDQKYRAGQVSSFDCSASTALISMHHKFESRPVGCLSWPIRTGSTSAGKSSRLSLFRVRPYALSVIQKETNDLRA